MKKQVLGLAMTVMTAQSFAVEPVKALESGQQEISYSFGAVFGMRMRNDIPELDIPAFVQGLSDTYQGKATLLTDEKMQQVLATFQRDMQQKQLDSVQKIAVANKKAETEFLTANREKEGVISLASGLQYKILVEGRGPQAALSDVVKLHYTGSLLNGQVFDTSMGDKPVEVPVNGAIAGWTEALQLMPEGSKWQLFIPSALAYGQKGNREIGPNEVLLFEVELLEVQRR